MLVKKIQTTGNVFSFQNWRQVQKIKPHPPTFRTLERGSFIISDEALNSLSPDMEIHILLSVLYTFVWN